VILLQATNETPVDIALGALPFEEEVVERSSTFEFDAGYSLRTCSAEDLIVLKLFANRPKDVADAETVVLRHPELDWRHVQENLSPLAEIKGDREILATLDRLRRL
jgi:hypothetical protein